MSTNKKEIKHGLNTAEELELPEWEELDSIRAGVKQW